MRLHMNVSTIRESDGLLSVSDIALTLPALPQTAFNR